MHLGQIPAQLRYLWGELRASLWFVPGLMAAGAIVLALAVLRVDEWLGSSWIRELNWIYSRSASGARDLLSTVAASMITIAGLAFSILIVALQLASSQFGPRVLRNYMRDRGSQFVLGTFIATFLYCLMVMRTIADVDEDEPRLAVTLAVALAVASLVVLIYFLHHSAASIHAPNVINAVARDLTAAIEQRYPGSVGEPAPEVDIPATPSECDHIRAPAAGYIQQVDGDALMEAARDADVTLRVLHRPGDFVFADQEIVAAWPGGRLDGQARRRACSAFIIGAQRTGSQDVEFSFEQLIQIALRALSPAFNDPFTAISCIEHLGAALHNLLQRREPPAVRVDPQGFARVIAPPVAIAQVLSLTLMPLVESAGESTLVVRQLVRTMAALAPSARTADIRRALSAPLQALLEHAETLPASPLKDELRADGRRALAVLSGVRS